MKQHSFAAFLVFTVREAFAMVDCDNLTNPAVNVDSCKMFPEWAEAMAANGDYGWHHVEMETTDGYLINLLHILGDPNGDELVDNINFEPLLMLHDFTREAVDFFEVDDEEEENFYRDRRNALPV